jgi:hypothetical protein
VAIYLSITKVTTILLLVLISRQFFSLNYLVQDS